MKRICFISLTAYGYFNEEVPADGGAERQFHLISTNLTDQFDVHFVVGDYGQPQIENQDGVTLHRAYRPAPSASKLERGKQIAELFQILRQVDADVYLTRCSPRKLAVIFPLLTVLRKPLVYHIAVDTRVKKSKYNSGIRKRVYKNSLPRISKVIAQTPYQAEQLRTHWDISSTIIPNGYPPANIVDLHDSREHFLWVGRLKREQKRPHLYLDLAEQFPDQKFVLIGDGQKNAYTDKIIKRASDMPNVVCTGWVPPSEIHQYYREAIALINTSTSEGFPNVFLEAWRFATPVIGLYINPERFLKNDASSSSYAENDFESLVNITKRMTESPDIRRELGVRGMKSFNDKYHIEKVVDSYQSLIEQID